MVKIIRHFLLLLGAGLVGAMLGAAFGATLASLSPELMDDMYGTRYHPVRYATSVFMLVGMFLVGLSMAFCIFIATVKELFRPKVKSEDKKRE